MLFNSYEFLIFLPIVFLLYWFVFKPLKWQNLFIVIASYTLWMVGLEISAPDGTYYIL